MASTLKLVFEKGPRSGETREYNPNPNPKSKIRIGRTVKGNNLQIKDDAISSQHLTIHFDSGSGKWVITDLDSSNGTHLNSSKLKPLSPFELTNSDEIKIGDSTSIRVHIVGGEEEEQIFDNRRNPRKKCGDDVECPNLGRGRGRGRGRGKKEVVLAADGNVEQEEEEDVKKPKEETRMATTTRMTRNSKREGDELLSLERVAPVRRTTRSMKNVDKEVENVAFVESTKKNGRGRGRKKKVEFESSENVNDVIVEDTTTREEVEQQLEVPDVREETREVVESKKRTRGGRGRKKKVEVEDSEDVKDVILEDATTREEVSRRLEVQDVREEPIGDTVQQYSLEGEMAEELSQLKVLDEREEPMGNTVQETPLEDTMNREVSEAEVPEQVGGERDVKQQYCKQPIMGEMARENDNRASASCFEHDASERLENDMVLEGGEVEETEAGEVFEELETEINEVIEEHESGTLPDLEKMTLGEWFDFLKVYLPKQINGVRDEVILDMRQRAKQFNDFMLQLQNEKGKEP